jgi:segregation and condensation protein B
MAISTQDNDLNDPLRNIGPDSTAVFDESGSNPTEHASSENLGAASELEDEDVEDEEEGEDDDVEEDLDEEDDDDEDEEEEDDDEEDEDEDDDEDELQVTKRR